MGFLRNGQRSVTFWDRLSFVLVFLRLVGDKIHRNRVYAVSCVRFCEAFALKNVTQVCAASGALYLGSDSISVGETFHCTWDFFVEAWPAAVGFEFVFGAVEFGAAAFAYVCSVFPEGVVFACEGGFGAFFEDDVFFFFGELFGFGFFV